MKDNICLIHVHVPKTGGSTFNRALKRMLPSTNMLGPSSFEQKGINAPPILYELFAGRIQEKGQDFYDFIFGHMEFGVHRLLPDRRCRYTCLLRNPLDRMLSEFVHKSTKGVGPRAASSKAYFSAMSLDEYIEWRCNTDLGRLGNFQARRITGLENPTYEQAVEILDKYYDVVGVTEELDLALQAIAWLYDLQVPNYETRNVSKYRYTSKDVLPELRREFYKNELVDYQLWYKYQSRWTLFSRDLRAVDSNWDKVDLEKYL